MVVHTSKKGYITHQKCYAQIKRGKAPPVVAPSAPPSRADADSVLTTPSKKSKATSGANQPQPTYSRDIRLHYTTISLTR